MTTTDAAPQRARSIHDLLKPLDAASDAPSLRLQRSSSEGMLSPADTIDRDPPPPSFFFTGCAWGCAFHVGAYHGMVERWGVEKLACCKFGGNSAGCIMAVAAVTGASWELLEETYLQLAQQAKMDGVVGKMSIYHSAALEKLVGPTTHLDVAGRLFVGVTFASGFEVISSWASRAELLDTLHASMHIPFYCTHLAPCAGGRTGVDGGLAAPFHLMDAATLVIDPFGSSSLSMATLEPIFPILGKRARSLRRPQSPGSTYLRGASPHASRVR